MGEEVLALVSPARPSSTTQVDETAGAAKLAEDGLTTQKYPCIPGS